MRRAAQSPVRSPSESTARCLVPGGGPSAIPVVVREGSPHVLGEAALQRPALRGWNEVDLDVVGCGNLERPPTRLDAEPLADLLLDDDLALCTYHIGH